MQNLTPLMKQFLAVKAKHTDKIVLFRMGDFYETFFEDAVVASKILGITLTTRDKSSPNPISLAGFPYHALDIYLDKLVKAGQKVVIVEQLEDPKLAQGLVKRDVIEVITPGAILDEQLLTSSNHNFLASVYLAIPPTVKNEKDVLKSGGLAGLALIDLSTGDFLFTEVSIQNVSEEILRQKPREILIESKLAETVVASMHLDFPHTLTVFTDFSYDYDDAQSVLTQHFDIHSLQGIGAKSKKTATVAAAAALAYVKSLRKEDLKHIVNIRYYSLENYMIIDETTRRNLELFLSMRNSTRQGSLIDILDETRTPMGGRLLSQWLTYPLKNPDDIASRLDATSDFYESIAHTKDLRLLFQKIGDLGRIISRLATQRVNPRDLLTLASFLDSAPEIVTLLDLFHATLIVELKSKITSFEDIINQIRNTLLPNPSMTIKEGNIINSGIHAELDEMRQIATDGKKWIARLEESEKQITGIPSLKIGFNKVFGYYIEITNTHKHRVPKNYICKQTLVNCERYISPQLKENEAKVLGAEERIKSIEYEIFVELRKQLSEKVNALLAYVDVIAQLDVLSNFAFISWQNNYKRPTFNTDGILDIKDCRHPVIEKLFINEQFIPNDVYLNDTDHKIAIITGPNMAGKSTYLRQIGLCVLMAQIGCYMPCKSANIPIFDRIFTRVGASDNLASGQSTFLVEMIETANILHNSTPNSLILLDEIGRGTSTFDGLSLAWSIVEYIHENAKISAKTLFATHYHELTELENILPTVKNYNIAVKEWNEHIIFIRKIERGGCDQSYGIFVARLAGIPTKVISRAKEILHNLEAIEISPQGLTARIKKQLNKNTQTNLFDILISDSETKDKKLTVIKDMLMEIDINNISPMHALQTLEQMKKIVLD